MAYVPQRSATRPKSSRRSANRTARPTYAGVPSHLLPLRGVFMLKYFRLFA